MVATIYHLNKSPTKSVLDRTPYKPLMGGKPRVIHLKVFGYIAYCDDPPLDLVKREKNLESRRRNKSLGEVSERI